MSNVLATLVAWVIAVTAAGAAPPPPEPVELPPPQVSGGMPLMEALGRRASAREFAPEPLPAQTLSDLLWAAWGINRGDSGRRTAPSARNWQDMDVYVVTAAGAYRYQPAGNRLLGVAGGDLRGLAGTQEFVRTAPATLVLVSDTRRMRGAGADTHQAYAWAHAGFISQNIYLFCASAGLNTVVRAMVDRPALAAALGLEEHHVIVFAQSVGFAPRPEQTPES